MRTRRSLPASLRPPPRLPSSTRLPRTRDLTVSARSASDARWHPARAGGRDRSPKRVLVAAVAMLASILLLGLDEGHAADCGGTTPCECGDTVASDYRLPGDLGPCPGHGLTVRSHVRLDCQGHAIRGVADGSDQYGIYLQGSPRAELSGATVENCEVTRFLRGIRLRAASGNTLLSNVVHGNGNATTRVGYGIDLGGESRQNTLRGNRVYRNADEGIHVGTRSHDNRFVDNVVTDNQRENVYLLASDRGSFVGNTVGGAGGNSIYVKDSSFNVFEGNTFLRRTARVVGDSHDNRFLHNTFAGAGLHFECYRKSARCPSRNHVTGGSIADASECLRFIGSHRNVVTEAILRRCGVELRAESPIGPTENTIIGHDPDKVALAKDSSLQVGYRLNVRVEDECGMALPGAEVHVTDATGTLVVSGLTDEAGALPGHVVIKHTRIGSTTRLRTPHVLTTTKPGYSADARAVSVTEHSSLTIVLRRE